MKIEKWQVENGIAKPKNPFKQSETDNFTIVNVDEVGKYAAFEQFAQQHTYATNAPPGIHSAEMFGEAFEQINYYDTWQTLLKDEINTGHEIRSFLPYNNPMAFHPLNPNANAIKIIEGRIEELHEEKESCTHENLITKLGMEIGALAYILKLLQS